MLKELFEEITQGWNQATKEQFTGHPLARTFRQDLEDQISQIASEYNPSYIVKASVGAGNWANVPWISILDPDITTTTQDGIYPVYLFKADGSGIYLSLIQGTTNPTKRLGKSAAEARAKDIKEMLLQKLTGLKSWGIETISLNATTSLGKSYEQPSIIAKYYDAKAIPNDELLKKDLLELFDFYRVIKEKGYDQERILFSQPTENPIVTVPSFPLSKPFLLLAGISGTGKTRFVRQQALRSNPKGELQDTFCQISVRPDWHDPTDLLGYTSRITGKEEYVSTELLAFIVKAWQEISHAGLQMQTDATSGVESQLKGVRPFWLCLDEMNLAPVEQYFADYLSVIETRKWEWNDDTFSYRCDPLLKPTVIRELPKDGKQKLREKLNLAGNEYDVLWRRFCDYGISIPFNLMVAGTVNMDETTHGFSRKVIDRALSFDFEEFFPNHFDEFFEPETEPEIFSYPTFSDAKSETDNLPDCDTDGHLTIAFLKDVNEVLKGTQFELAYRALNELLISVICAQPETDVDLQAVWDDFLMCKVLPRIDGDHDKLSSLSSSETLLDTLMSVLASHLPLIWDNTRPDVYRKSMADQSAQPVLAPCRSQKKLQWMINKFNQSGFTSFWP
ncbi:hypothetical protein VA7868_04533 [Vibrio aerogenes CECT 7868]|uniref:Type IV methyl-directed restriction enzyme EcoKMcrB subunit DNA-binding domain-containing protein n=1 Tax=Vibrio aerogenes CECT 7868 TaxID=1216006 RepID=A0A1M6EW54_9VIBR|nr:DUF3578 domain-containing protein [Vibrio aerogenes]SHI89717.1 hypothetical protein VA7868_04533 [Vibrio aerogenes CECT 7868]